VTKEEKEQMAELQQRAETAEADKRAAEKQLAEAQSAAQASAKTGKGNVNVSPETIAVAAAMVPQIQSATMAVRQPVDLKAAGYEGAFKMHGNPVDNADNTFGLRVKKPEEVMHGRTHQAMSQLEYWEGTEEEFRARFEKK
jgi:uncharacterized protein (DUF3084 family)